MVWKQAQFINPLCTRQCWTKRSVYQGFQSLEVYKEVWGLVQIESGGWRGANKRCMGVWVFFRGWMHFLCLTNDGPKSEKGHIGGVSKIFAHPAHNDLSLGIWHFRNSEKATSKWEQKFCSGVKYQQSYQTYHVWMINTPSMAITMNNILPINIFSRELLSDVVTLRVKLFEMSKTRTTSAEEYLKVGVL